MVEAAARAAVPLILSFLAHSCPPFHLTCLLDSTVDHCKFPICTLQSETFPFISSLSPFAGASSASEAEQIRRSRPPRVQSADGGDVAGRLPQQRAWWRRVRVAGVRPTRVCFPASSEPASCERPNSPASGELACARFARPDAPLCRLRARLVPFVSGWACRERAARTSNLMPSAHGKVRIGT